MHSKAKNSVVTRHLLRAAILLVSAIASAQTQPVTATIDASKTGPPISKYIYGQFLEHIGGIVNNNIWAEMLDDRKFYLSDHVASARRTSRTELETHRSAPLDPDRRRRIRDDGYEPSYVGDHTPMVKLSATEAHGIQQAGVAVRKGKSYTGRIVLAGTPGTTVKVHLVWGPTASDRQTVMITKLGSAYAKFPLRFQAQGDSDDAQVRDRRNRTRRLSRRCGLLDACQQRARLSRRSNRAAQTTEFRCVSLSRRELSFPGTSGAMQSAILTNARRLWIRCGMRFSPTTSAPMSS